jgi:hypothetical protein
VKKLLLTSAILLFSISSFSQVTIVGLARKSGANPQIFLSELDPTTGNAINSSATSIATSYNLTGAALNPYSNHYHFISNNSFYSVEMNTGTIVSSPTINNPIAPSYFDNFRFNNSDSLIYGLARRSVYDSINNTYVGQLFLATINPNTGTITQISQNSVGQSYALTGSAIDPFQKVFYYSTGGQLVGLDMYTGAIYSNPNITIPGSTISFDNFTYSCADTALYGLARTNHFSSYYDSTLMMMIQLLDSTTIKLGKINTTTGLVTEISPYSIYQGAYSLNASSTIDPNTMTYYFGNGAQVIGISMISGLIVSTQNLNISNGDYFDMMRIAANCEQAVPTRTNPLATGINELEQANVKAYPNPAQNTLHLNSTENIQLIRITSMSGQELMQFTANSKEVSMDVSGLSSGMYIINCNSEKGSTRKLFSKY